MLLLVALAAALLSEGLIRDDDFCFSFRGQCDDEVFDRFRGVLCGRIGEIRLMILDNSLDRLLRRRVDSPSNHDRLHFLRGSTFGQHVRLLDEHVVRETDVTDAHAAQHFIVIPLQRVLLCY